MLDDHAYSDPGHTPAPNAEGDQPFDIASTPATGGQAEPVRAALDPQLHDPEANTGLLHNDQDTVEGVHVLRVDDAGRARYQRAVGPLLILLIVLLVAVLALQSLSPSDARHDQPRVKPGKAAHPTTDRRLGGRERRQAHKTRSLRAHRTRAHTHAPVTTAGGCASSCGSTQPSQTSRPLSRPVPVTHPPGGAPEETGEIEFQFEN
jgi:hypothetical protein